MIWLRLRGVVFLSLLLLCLLPCHAQRERESALSDAEVETLRDTAYAPADRVLAFVRFLDDRALAIDKLGMGRRQPGREEDLHDAMAQMTSILDDFEDNLDDYSRRHKDVRKALPKALTATERWATALKTPPEMSAYGVQRKLGLEALEDVRGLIVKMMEEQKDYFKEHPPEKKDGRG